MLTIRAGVLARRTSEQKLGQQEICKMIKSKGHLKPLLGFLVCHEPRPGIVDQHMQAVIAPLEFGRQIPNLGLVRQVCHQEINPMGFSSVYTYCTVALHFSSFRPAITTVAPCFARPSAVALPIPEVPPVTRQTLPAGDKLSDIIFFSSHFPRWGH